MVSEARSNGIQMLFVVPGKLDPASEPPKLKTQVLSSRTAGSLVTAN